MGDEILYLMESGRKLQRRRKDGDVWVETMRGDDFRRARHPFSIEVAGIDPLLVDDLVGDDLVFGWSEHARNGETITLITTRGVWQRAAHPTLGGYTIASPYLRLSPGELFAKTSQLFAEPQQGAVLRAGKKPIPRRRWVSDARR